MVWCGVMEWCHLWWCGVGFLESLVCVCVVHHHPFVAGIGVSLGTVAQSFLCQLLWIVAVCVVGWCVYVFLVGFFGFAFW